jgi:hypothetical protein
LDILKTAGAGGFGTTTAATGWDAYDNPLDSATACVFGMASIADGPAAGGTDVSFLLNFERETHQSVVDCVRIVLLFLGFLCSSYLWCSTCDDIIRWWRYGFL